jgi:hypothetical protein
VVRSGTAESEGTLMTGSEHTRSAHSEEIAVYLGADKTTNVAAIDSGKIASSEHP